MSWSSQEKPARRWSVGSLGKSAVQNPLVLFLGAQAASKWLDNHSNSIDSFNTHPASPEMAPQVTVFGPHGQPMVMQGALTNGYGQCPYAYQGGHPQGMPPQNVNGQMGMPTLDLNGGGIAYNPAQAGYVPVQGSNGYPYADPSNSYRAFGPYALGWS